MSIRAPSLLGAPCELAVTAVIVQQGCADRACRCGCVCYLLRVKCSAIPHHLARRPETASQRVSGGIEQGWGRGEGGEGERGEEAEGGRAAGLNSRRGR